MTDALSDLDTQARRCRVRLVNRVGLAMPATCPLSGPTRKCRPPSGGIAPAVGFIELPNGRSADYEVGSKADAIIECRRIEDNKPPMFGPWAGMDLTERH
jgi:hypothetical protein